MRVAQLDHLVLIVRDMEATLDFYTRLLGMEQVAMTGGRRGLLFGTQQITVYPVGTYGSLHAAVMAPGAADICLILATPVAEAVAELAAAGVAIIAGPVARVGAQGPITSIYFRDPDGNLIELANYGN